MNRYIVYCEWGQGLKRRFELECETLGQAMDSAKFACVPPGISGRWRESAPPACPVGGATVFEPLEYASIYTGGSDVTEGMRLAEFRRFYGKEMHVVFLESQDSEGRWPLYRGPDGKAKYGGMSHGLADEKEPF